MAARPVLWLSILSFFDDTATTEIYTLSLHDALPISPISSRCGRFDSQDCSHPRPTSRRQRRRTGRSASPSRSEEHTSELQSQFHLVCRLLLEKKKTQITSKDRLPPHPHIT